MHKAKLKTLTTGDDGHMERIPFLPKPGLRKLYCTYAIVMTTKRRDLCNT